MNENSRFTVVNDCWKCPWVDMDTDFGGFGSPRPYCTHPSTRIRTNEYNPRRVEKGVIHKDCTLLLVTSLTNDISSLIMVIRKLIAFVQAFLNHIQYPKTFLPVDADEAEKAWKQANNFQLYFGDRYDGAFLERREL